MMFKIRRGDIFYVDFRHSIGHEQGGIRHSVVLQNDIGNHFSPTTVVIPMTTQIHKKPLPSHVNINCNIDVENTLLTMDSIVELEQIRTVDKCRVREKVGHICNNKMQEINQALLINLGITNIIKKESVLK